MARLEVDLHRFSGTLNRLRTQRARPWNAEELSAWREVLRRVEHAATFPMGSFPIRLLFQIRVILETERERNRRPSLPKVLNDRVDAVFVWVAHRLRARRGPSQETVPDVLRLSWPISPIIITSNFGYRRDPMVEGGPIRFHSGLDLGGKRGDLVRAAASGLVSAVGRNRGLGRWVEIQHILGIRTVYGHLSKTLVVEGMSVQRGDILGLVGNTGRSTGDHLHFEVRRGGTALDPLEFLDLH